LKTTTIVSAFLGLALSFSAVGCAKTTDLGKMQEETIASVKIYLGDLEVLQRRYSELVPMKGTSPEADKKLAAADQAITEGRTLAASAPTTVATAAKTANPEALTRAHDEIIEKLVANIELARDNLAAFEAFTTAVSYAATRPSTIPSSMPTPTTPDTGVANDGAGASSAAKMPAGGTAAGHTTDIPCSAEIALQCPDGQVDACIKTPTAATHACVPK
jgi:hypothetical protein